MVNGPASKGSYWKVREHNEPDPAAEPELSIEKRPSERLLENATCVPKIVPSALPVAANPADGTSFCRN